MKSYKDKCRELRSWMSQMTTENVMLAFSGGADSSLLLKIACDCAIENGSQVYALTIHTMLHPRKELELTKRLAEEMGAVHLVLEVDELEEAGIENNPKDRCYLCKRCMFTRLVEKAGHLGISRVMEGTNLDDTKEYRPGIRALTELGVLSPLMQCAFTKEEVRRLAAEYGIETADKPSTPCLATRFPYGTKLTYEELKKVEKMEEQIRAFGCYNIRARIHEKLVRIEVDEDDMAKIFAHKKEIIREIKALGYSYISLDLEGFRSGSQDIQ